MHFFIVLFFWFFFIVPSFFAVMAGFLPFFFSFFCILSKYPYRSSIYNVNQNLEEGEDNSQPGPPGELTAKVVALASISSMTEICHRSKVVNRTLSTVL